MIASEVPMIQPEAANDSETFGKHRARVEPPNCQCHPNPSLLVRWHTIVILVKRSATGRVAD